MLLKEMKVRSHLKPGQKGTKQLLEQFGAALLCVRYRYDAKRGMRLKTVEIVVEEKPWKQAPYHDADIVSVLVAFSEKGARERLKSLGGRWDPDKKVWRVAYGAIRNDMVLLERIVPD